VKEKNSSSATSSFMRGVNIINESKAKKRGEGTQFFHVIMFIEFRQLSIDNEKNTTVWFQ
jgi:hypothetical protein